MWGSHANVTHSGIPRLVRPPRPGIDRVRRHHRRGVAAPPRTPDRPRHLPDRRTLRPRPRPHSRPTRRPLRPLVRKTRPTSSRAWRALPRTRRGLAAPYQPRASERRFSALRRGADAASRVAAIVDDVGDDDEDPIKRCLCVRQRVPAKTRSEPRSVACEAGVQSWGSTESAGVPARRSSTHRGATEHLAIAWTRPRVPRCRETASSTSGDRRCAGRRYGRGGLRPLFSGARISQASASDSAHGAGRL